MVSASGASTFKVSVCVLPTSVLVVAAGVDGLATSTAVTIGWVVPAVWMVVVPVEGVAHVSASVAVAGVQAMGVGKPLVTGNVYSPTAPRPPAAVYVMAVQAPPVPVHPVPAPPKP
jgi:hypothetical protein